METKKEPFFIPNRSPHAVKHCNLRVNLPLYQRLEKIAKATGISISSLISQCCEYALEHLQEGIL